jgi:heterodisulfide reductase subunit C
MMAALHIICLAASVAVVVSLVAAAVVIAGHLMGTEEDESPCLRCIHCGGVVCAGQCPCGRAHG